MLSTSPFLRGQAKVRLLRRGGSVSNFEGYVLSSILDADNPQSFRLFAGRTANAQKASIARDFLASIGRRNSKLSPLNLHLTASPSQAVHIACVSSPKGDTLSLYINELHLFAPFRPEAAA